MAGALALAACGEAPHQPPAGPLVTTTSSNVVTTTSLCAHLPPERGGCGLTFEEQRGLNQRYAERLPFRGRSEDAAVIVDEVRVALGRFSGQATDPAPDEVRAALARWEPDVQVTSNAVRTAGTAFAISVKGGCVFGTVNRREVSVEVGGIVRDGGCLAVNGH